MKLVAWCAVFTFTPIPLLTHYFLGWSTTGALLIAALIFGIGSESLPFISQKISERLSTLLKTESIHRTLVALITPFIILEVSQSLATTGTGTLIGSIASPLSTLVIALGTGILIGTILLRIVKQFTNSLNSPIIIIIGAIITYALAEYFNVGGIVGVIAYGLFLGNSYVRERITFLKQEKMFTKVLYSFLCIIAGLTITPPTLNTLLIALLLYIVFTINRSLVLWFSTATSRLSTREYWYAVLTTPRGAGTVSVLLLIASTTTGTSLNTGEISTILSTGLSFVIISLIIATIVLHSPLFPRIKENKQHKRTV